MECTQTQTPKLSNKEYLKEFNKKVAQRRIPLSGNLALTHRCNVRCIHCYIREEAATRGNPGKELGTDQWKTIIDKITEAGCLYLLITGGEPLLRKDFDEIYRHARTNGLLVTVFTNGTLISENIIELFNEFPPRAVEISLYGATAETYETITGVKGSFEKCLNGIKRLMDFQINVRLKTILMKQNSHEFFKIEKMVGEWGVKFRFDAAIFPRLNGDKAPIGLRVPAEDAVEKEFSDENRLREWKDFFGRMSKLPVLDSLYQCGAGMTHFHIDPYGNLRPCLMVTDLEYNLVNGSFFTGWNEVMPRIRERKPGTGYGCNQCEKRVLCGFCPAFFNLEKGTEDLYSEYLCSMGQQRFEKINEVL
ncbi:MAG: radical SAM protein [Candidatus Aminicenantes bacterium]|nr:radical SAM protein [Candidatus Aminicenantes bacterium]NIM84308.1 radical SAM protein [Candidatus Aminicenantes bacterium]NIN23794.1 radical SAM protein [Candidatus Aminicenantes bacterium]NIN47510.1 radical SAM protein [Candidatus Aminicenantes bacterium]NIN90430.1 radical SAM protein [Candidatus Aminicenantes bacterium]